MKTNDHSANAENLLPTTDHTEDTASTASSATRPKPGNRVSRGRVGNQMPDIYRLQLPNIMPDIFGGIE